MRMRMRMRMKLLLHVNDRLYTEEISMREDDTIVV